MLSYPLPANEAERLTSLQALDILDTPPTGEFDRIVRLAQQVFNVPIALVSLLDEHRQWFKARCGLESSQTPRAVAFCNYTILHQTVFVVEDAAADARFAANPLVQGEPKIRFYAGAPLTVGKDLHLGSLCVIDRRPRTFSEREAQMLSTLARLTVDELWIHALARKGVVEPPPGRLRADFDIPQNVTPAQIRGGRGMLNWSVRELATASGTSIMTVKRAEAGEQRAVSEESLAKLRGALEQAGVEFTFAYGSLPGIRPASKA